MDLAWGKCTIFTAKLVNGSPSTWKKWYTPVENSTQLNPTKGDKKEAKIEGGENEAVKYARNTYQLVFNIRSGNEDGTPREKIVEDDDGVIEGEYALKLQPENAEVPGFTIDRCVLSESDNFSTEEGGRWDYTADALRPSTGKTIKWGVITDPTISGS